MECVGGWVGLVGGRTGVRRLAVGGPVGDEGAVAFSRLATRRATLSFWAVLGGSSTGEPAEYGVSRAALAPARASSQQGGGTVKDWGARESRGERVPSDDDSIYRRRLAACMHSQSRIGEILSVFIEPIRPHSVGAN